MFKKLGQSFSKFQERHPTAKTFVGWAKRRRVRLVFYFWFVAHLLGALTSVRAIMEVRTAQGTIAWVTALNAAPVVCVPAYWIFGRSEFQGYVLTRRKDLEKVNPTAQQYLKDLGDRGLLA